MTHVLDSQTTTVPRRSVHRDRFFAGMSTVTLVIVLAGFARTLYLRPVFQPEPIPVHLYVHGLVLTSWFVWLWVQTLLVQTGRTALHRRLGLIGGVLAAIVPFAGLLATAGAPARIVAAGFPLDADASALGIGVSGSILQFASGVVWGNVSSAVSFAALAWTGLAQRRRPVIHKRLMLLATIAILGPALARLSRWSIFGGREDGPFVPAVLLSLLTLVIAHDLVTTRRIHAATLIGIGVAIGSFVAASLVAQTEFGFALVRWLV